MLKQQILVIVIPLLITGNAFGQKVIYGQVTDANTNEPLPFSNIYVNHTTIGTVANQNGSYSLAIPRGEYEVVCSFVGYQSVKIQTSAQAPDSVRMDIKLVPSQQELESVVVHSGTDKEWEKLVKQFQKILLGKTPAAASCVIRNNWCIDLKKERISGQQVLTARASQQLEIENSTLGYKLFYDLQEFSASKKNIRFSGNVYFVEMKPKDTVEAESWARNRQQSYRGSVRHLFKSILEKRSREEGFTLSVYQSAQNNILQTAYTPTRIQFDSLNRKYTIPMENDVAIYFRSSPSSYPKVATMSFVNHYVEVDNNGAVLDPLSFIITGYLGLSRVANLLPNDYQPTNQYNIAVPLLPSDEVARFQLPDGTFVAVTGDIDELDGTPASPILDSLEKRVNDIAETRPSEKVYVHFDKPFYYAGEDSWYKAYVVNKSDLSPTEISSVLYLDWIDPSGNVLKHQRLKIDSGAAVGDFALGPSVQEGMYTVRAYTNWMRNEDTGFFYYKKLPVFNTLSGLTSSRKDPLSEDIDIQFFPEGGKLVSGIMTSIALKAIDTNGRGISVQGKIIDEQNNQITTFHSIHNGMGVFPLIAQPKKSYYAVLPNGKKFSLPYPTDQALSLAVSNMNENKVLVRIRFDKENKSSSAYLLAHSRGSIYFAESVELQSPQTDIAISKNELPEGVVQFTLFDADGIPQSERMVFIQKERGMSVTISSDKLNFQPRDSIFLDVEVKDRDGYPVETSLSVSVTDAGFVTSSTNSENIYTQLLLQSDIKGYVEQPEWYFDSVSTQKLYALDLVMLTHGWSRYQWNKMLTPTSEPVTYQPEMGITLKGQITDKDKPVANTPFTVTTSQAGYDYFNIYESDSLGHFSIPDLDFSDSTTFSWRVMSARKGKVQNAEIKLDAIQEMPPVNLDHLRHQIGSANRNEFYNNLLVRFAKTGVWSLDNTTMLEEVVVTAERIKVKSVGPSAILIKPDDIDLKSRISTAQLVSRYSLAGKIHSISINGYVEDGDPFTILSAVSIEQIEFVIVGGNIHDGYGISIVTKSITAQESVGAVRKLAWGYDKAREFYHPKYGPLDVSTTAQDNRMTLYWNANVQTDKGGNATIKFYNTDYAKTFQIVVEGIANGVPIHSTSILGEN